MAFVQKTFHLHTPTPLFLFLMREFSIPQKEAQKWIDKGRVRIQGEPFLDKSARVSGELEVLFFRPDSRGLEPLFITPFFALFDKPADLLVHPKGTFEHYSLMDEVRLRFGQEADLAHRIDKETSGIVLVTRSKKEGAILKINFFNREVKKCYWALVRGKMEGERILDFPLKAQSKRLDLGVRMRVDEEGKSSLTQIKALDYEALSDTTLVEASPLTGRTHQIRLHLAHAGHPILGDPLYGTSDELSRAYLEQAMDQEARRRCFGASRLMLHAQGLGFPYKRSWYEIVSGQDFLGEVEGAREALRRFRS